MVEVFGACWRDLRRIGAAVAPAARVGCYEPKHSGPNESHTAVGMTRAIPAQKPFPELSRHASQQFQLLQESPGLTGGAEPLPIGTTESALGDDSLAHILLPGRASGLNVTPRPAMRLRDPKRCCSFYPLVLRLTGEHAAGTDMLLQASRGGPLWRQDRDL